MAACHPERSEGSGVLTTVRGHAAQIPRKLPLISHLCVYQIDIHPLLVCRQAHEWLGMTIEPLGVTRWPPWVTVRPLGMPAGRKWARSHPSSMLCSFALRPSPFALRLWSTLCSVVGRRSSVVGRRSSVVGRRSSVVGRRSSVVSLATCYLLPATCYLLPATCYLLPATCYLLPATCYLLLASSLARNFSSSCLVKWFFTVVRSFTVSTARQKRSLL
jgi:hypothetical protein